MMLMCAYDASGHDTDVFLVLVFLNHPVRCVSRGWVTHFQDAPYVCTHIHTSDAIQ